MNVPPLLQEKELLKKLCIGEEQAFERLYRHYSDATHRVVFRLVQSEMLADEILQNVFVKIWEKRHLVQSVENFKAWLLRIAENEVYNYYRKIARDKKLQAHIIENFAYTTNPTEEYVVTKEQRALLEKAVAYLPEKRRQVFILCKLEGKSYEEAGHILGISPNTVKNQLISANGTLRRYVLRFSEGFVLIVYFSRSL
jgi:RNA polymerase sigma-70 factor (ECF subfamily)